MNKRIGIFTYMLNNYGAVLQAYALQRYLRDHSDNDVEVIDFTTKQHLLDDRVLKRQSKDPLKNVVLSIWVFLHFFELARRRKRTHIFKKEYISFSRRFSTMEEVLSNPPIEDVYVSGSDQVFNTNSMFSDVYYLKFDKKSSTKVAYAASFGFSEFNNSLKEKIVSAIDDFDYLSCREISGAAFLSSITGKDIPVVLDPTLLLSAEEWMRVTNLPQCSAYICVYDLNGKEDLIKIAQIVKANTELKIVCITSNLRQHYDVDKVVYDAGPSEFLGWIAGADYVVTDSFHGASFSIIFNKPFSSFIALQKNADRLYTLLSEVGQESRIIEKSRLNGIRIKDLCLDRPDVDLSKLQRISIDYIEKAILQ